MKKPPVCKDEWVAVMSLLGTVDRERYRELRGVAWDAATISLRERKSEQPN